LKCTKQKTVNRQSTFSIIMIAIIMETYDNNKISHYVSSAIFTPVTFLVNDIEILTHQMECWCSEDGRIHWMFFIQNI